MAHTDARILSFEPPKLARFCAVLAASLMMTACAGLNGGAGPDFLAASDPTPEAAAGGSHSELQKATAYWGKKFSNSPMDLKAALAYAKNLKAMGQKRQALAVLQQSAVFHGDSMELASEYGRLALALDQVGIAAKALARADNPSKPDWRVISARGTVMAKQGKYAEAIPFYERAIVLKPDQPSILSNLALARAMNGQAAEAEQLLRRASANDPNNAKVRQNLAIVLGLQGKYDEAKQIAAKDLPPEKAAQNTALLRQIVRLPAQAAPNAGVAYASNAPALRQSKIDKEALAAAWGATTVASAQ